MQFLLIAHDGDDDLALGRRMRARTRTSRSATKWSPVGRCFTVVPSLTPPGT